MDPKQARWFSMELRESDAPWLFEAKRIQSRSTVAEMLASYAALEVFGYFKKGVSPQQIVVEAGTDNQATEYVSAKGASNKFPLAYVQAQLGLKCFLHGLIFKLKWRPREENVEADDLTNSRFQRFSQEKRCTAKWEDLDLTIMDKLLRFRMKFQSWKEDRKRIQPGPPRASKRQKLASKTKW